MKRRNTLAEETSFLATRLRCTKMDINDARQMGFRQRASIAQYILEVKTLRVLEKLARGKK